VVLPKSIVADPRLDYVALGHIHKHQVLSQGKPPIIYPGSLERIDFGEERDKKGFMAVEIDEPGPDGKRAVRHEFHEVDARRFLTIKVNADTQDPTAEVLRRIEERVDDIKDAVVRVSIEISPERERELRQDEVRRALSAAKPSYMSVTLNVARAHRALLGDQGIAHMTPEEALKLYLQNKSKTVEQIEVYLKFYRQLSGALADNDRSKASD